MGLLIDILIIYIVFSTILFLANYYINLIKSKDTYTRNEIINPMPIFSILSKSIAEKYPVMNLIGTIVIFSFIGIIFTLLEHWIFRSAVLSVIFFILFPMIVKYFDERHVSDYDNYYDLAKNYFSRFNEIIFYSYSLGSASVLIYKWGAERELSFIFFIANLLVISILISLLIQKNIASSK